MKNVKAYMLGLLLLTAFAPMQGSAMASYSSKEEGSYAKESPLSDTDVVKQAAKELRRSNPELSSKLEVIASKLSY